MTTIVHFMDFIYTIVAKAQDELVPLIFCENGISVKIILAISDSSSNIDKPVREAEEAIQNQRISTVYVLATGSKISYAKAIAKAIYDRNPQEVFEPIETDYKRYTRDPFGSKSICYEINAR